MSRFQPLDYDTLDISGENYLRWAINISVILKTEGLSECIIKNDHGTENEKYMALTVMHHHLNKELRNQYQDIQSPRCLWTELKSRYTKVLLPKVRHEWMSLRFRDFGSVEEYNYALSKAAHTLILCGEKLTEEELLEKVFSTADPRDLTLQLTYRDKGFTTYNDLFLYLSQNEQMNQIKDEMSGYEADSDENDDEESMGATSKVTDGVAGLTIV
ncbi:uncharacterized protein LOC108837751 [Raphanus sativus]|uniref:Uncharacterized protein LOC108837751 n=1 Tax=Raphanus sativus TaxID=3726 RepID=A0A6J0M1U9_RAPSA|nr:uncharacterized protein LOC108837751 [Raphanus sativus]